jgi:hypothetical protein
MVRAGGVRRVRYFRRLVHLALQGFWGLHKLLTSGVLFLVTFIVIRAVRSTTSTVTSRSSWPA